MGVKIPYTSTTDRLLNIPRVIVNIFYLMFFVGGLIYLFDESDVIKKMNLNQNIEIAIFIAIAIGGFILSGHVYSKTAGRFFRTLSAYLYVKRELKTSLTWKEADFVSFLFTPNASGKWYTMYNVLKLPENQRKQYIISFAEKIINQ